MLVMSTNGLIFFPFARVSSVRVQSKWDKEMKGYTISMSWALYSCQLKEKKTGFVEFKFCKCKYLRPSASLY